LTELLKATLSEGVDRRQMRGWGTPHPPSGLGCVANKGL
jgi:hypothetical protein